MSVIIGYRIVYAHPAEPDNLHRVADYRLSDYPDDETMFSIHTRAVEYLNWLRDSPYNSKLIIRMVDLVS